MLIHFIYVRLDEIGGLKKRKPSGKKAKEASPLLKAVIHLDLFRLVRVPDLEEEMTFSGFDQCSAIDFILLLITIILWDPSLCSYHKSVPTEGPPFRPKEHVIQKQ